jgi:RNA-directed DNA polymerase
MRSPMPYRWAFGRSREVAYHSLYASFSLVRRGIILGGGGALIVMRAQFSHSYENIIAPENLLAAWREFLRGKRGRDDVMVFERHLANNIFALHRDLSAQTYAHGPYQAFSISDPKPRSIHKASVLDRLVHHAVHRELYPFFDRVFINHSYSCREGKGTHRAMESFRAFSRKVSRNDTRTCWVLKCDIRKFFASVDQAVLLDVLRGYIPDERILWLLEGIVGSFHTGIEGKGLPLGNLTSQLLVNVYMNEFDQFAKHQLKARHYLRYADDFAFLSHDRDELEAFIPRVADFLSSQLKLSLHPDKVSISTLASGVDFLGWVHFPDHRVLRTVTKRRALKRLAEQPKLEVQASYLGMLKHGNAHELTQRLEALVSETGRSSSGLA